MTHNQIPALPPQLLKFLIWSNSLIFGAILIVAAIFYFRRGSTHTSPSTESDQHLSGGLTENTSGQGDQPVIPEGVEGWSWGAFLLNWIWALGNETYIGLLVLVPVVGFVMVFVLGFKGREWAWRNKRWQSLDHFNRVQRKWSQWGVALTILPGIIGIAAAIIIPNVAHLLGHSPRVQ